MAIERLEVLVGMALIATGVYLGLRTISEAIGRSFKEVTEQAISVTGNAEIKLSTTDVTTTIVAGSFKEVTEQAISVTGNAETKLSTTDVTTTIVAGPAPSNDNELIIMED